MPLRDKLRLGAIRKWRLYGRFPWKLLIRVLISTCAIAHVLVLNTDATPYSVGGSASLRALLLPTQRTLYRRDDVVDAVVGFARAFSLLPEQSTGFFSFDGTRGPEVDLSARTFLHDPFRSTETGPLELVATMRAVNGTVAWPLEDKAAFFSRLVTLRLDARVRGLHIAGRHSRYYIWVVRVTFDFQSGSGSVPITFYARPEQQSSDRAFVGSDILCVMLICSCGVGLFLAVKAVRAKYLIFWELRKRALKKMAGRADATPRVSSFSELPFRSKIRFIRIWVIVTMLGDVFLVISSCLFLVAVNKDEPSEGLVDESYLFLGSGTFISLIHGLSYLSDVEGYSVFVRTLGGGLPKIARFVASVAPLFVGFMLFGVANYSRCSSKFVSPVTTAYNLFSFTNGDGVAETFSDLYRCPGVPQFITQAYLYAYGLTFIFVVANCAIFVIESSFFSPDADQNEHSQTLLDEWGAICEELDEEADGGPVSGGGDRPSRGSESEMLYETVISPQGTHHVQQMMAEPLLEK